MTVDDVDHIDRDGLNNQKENLRICSNGENQRNRKPKGSSKFKGVYLFKGKYWKSQIRHNNIEIHIGYFKTEEEAALAYDQLARSLFGEFARLNFSNRESIIVDVEKILKRIK